MSRIPVCTLISTSTTQFYFYLNVFQPSHLVSNKTNVFQSSHMVSNKTKQMYIA